MNKNKNLDSVILDSNFYPISHPPEHFLNILHPFKDDFQETLIGTIKIFTFHQKKEKLILQN